MIMQDINENDDFMLFLKGAEIEMIGNKMIQEVRGDNTKLGIPLVYSVDGMIFYELADGTITKCSPFNDKKSDENKK